MPQKNTPLANFVAVAEKLPTLPTAALEIVKISRREDVDMYALAAIIARDPAMSARVMRLANSALYKRRNEISTVQNAVLTLGSKAVKLAALSFALTSVANPDEDLGEYKIQVFWKRALIQSVVARSLCTELGMSFTEEASTGALLMDLSIPVLVRLCGADYAPVVSAMECGHPDSEVETSSVGTTHSVVGSYLMKEWSLPPRLVEAVSNHHTPEALEGASSADVLGITRILNLSHVAATLFMSHDAKHLAEFSAKVIPWFNVDDAAVTRILGTLDEPIKEFAEVMKVQLPQGENFSDILAQAREQVMNLTLTTAAENIQLQDEKEAAKQAAEIDQLSGLKNRRALDDVMTREWKQRTNQEFPDPLGVLVLDIDKLKNVNDTYGHSAGDKVIQSIGQTIRSSIRSTDSVYRWGGEEFVVIAPGASGATLRALGERVRRVIENTPVDIGEKMLTITVSVGTAAQVTDPAGKEPSTLFKAADTALYKAKESGRNKVVQGAEA